MKKEYFLEVYHRDGDCLISRIEESSGGLAVAEALAQITFTPTFEQPVSITSGVIIPTDEEVYQYGGEGAWENQTFPVNGPADLAGILREVKKVVRLRKSTGYSVNITTLTDTTRTESLTIEWFADTFADDDAEPPIQDTDEADRYVHAGTYL